MAANPHTVRIEPGRRLHTLFGKRESWFNGKHHQAVKDLAPGVTVAARAKDGVVEALEHPAPALCHRGSASRRHPVRRSVLIETLGHPRSSSSEGVVVLGMAAPRVWWPYRAVFETRFFMLCPPFF
jgi:hypothetical protein